MKVIKKIALAGTVMAVALATSAQAELFIDWSNPNGYFEHTDSDIGAAESLGGGLYGILVLLQPGEMLGGPTTDDLSGGGQVIAMGDLVGDGGGDNLYAFGSTITSPVLPFVPGSQVFARVFEATDAGSAAIEGVWYYDGPVAAVLDRNVGGTPPDPAQLYVANRDSAGSFGGAFGGDALNTGQVVLIPEPGTLALLGLGALTVMWRRRRD